MKDNYRQFGIGGWKEKTTSTPLLVVGVLGGWAGNTIALLIDGVFKGGGGGGY